MKKSVTFEKNINFSTMIGEITAISLEKNLDFIDSSTIEGELILSGKYKLTEASRLEEDFNYKIPIEITLTEKLDINTVNIEIVDFNYEIIGEDTINCKIELLIEGLEIIDISDNDEDVRCCEMEDRECDGDLVVEKEIEIPILEKKEEGDVAAKKKDEEVVDKSIAEEELEKETKKEKTLFIDVDDEEETYGTFVVYIVRQNETINSIIEKYNTSLEEIEKYNDIKEMGIGTKLIIPLLNE